MTSKRHFKNKQKSDTQNFMDIQNVDWERADEFLLNANKNKLEETYRNEDQEDLLFHEQDCQDMVTNVNETQTHIGSSRNKVKDPRSHSNCIHIQKFRRHTNSLVINDKKVIDNNQKPTHLSNKKIILSHGITEIANGSLTVPIKDPAKNRIDNNHKKPILRQEDSQIFKISSMKSHKQMKPQTHRHIETKEPKGNVNKIPGVTPNSQETRKQEVQRSQLDEIGPPLVKCTVESEQGSHRRPIRVNGSSLRLKMLERLQAAQSRYISSKQRRGRR